MDQPVLWQESRRILEQKAGWLRSEEGRLLAASVQWWEIPGFPERWPVAVLGVGPPLLMVQGFDTSFLDFQLLAVMLAQRHRVLIPDLCGLGFSPRVRNVEVSAAGILAHLEAILDSPGFEQAIGAEGPSLTAAPLGVIGASMGARVALDLARRRPERVARLMLISPAGLTEPPLPLPLPPLVEPFAIPFLRLWQTRFVWYLFMHANPARTFTYKQREIVSAHLGVPGWAWGLHAFFRSGGFGPNPEPFPSMPILALLGSKDRVLSGRQKNLLLTSMGSDLRELPGCGHVPHWEQPEMVARLWHDWLAQGASS